MWCGKFREELNLSKGRFGKIEKLPRMKQKKLGD
jgi:hypothetical protein